MSEVLLSVLDLSVVLGTARHRAVAGVSFDVHAGERVALLGPSGCGKTTLLRTIAGFERPLSGSITLAGRLLADATHHVPAHQRNTGMVFQDYALFPHLDVVDNVAFGIAHLPAKERARRTTELIELVGLTGFEERRPSELSGGQQQRVALARALAPKPRLLLLDEPFSSLDSGLRTATRRHTERVLSAASATALLVTHDQAEAMSFAQRLFVLRQGRIEQEGPPEQIYRSPRTAFVARFVGTANVLDAEATGAHASTPLGAVSLQGPAQGPVSLCLRPEQIRLGAPDREPRGEVVSREYQGACTVYRVRGAGFEVSAEMVGVSPLAVGGALPIVGDTVSLEVVGEAAVLAPHA